QLTCSPGGTINQTVNPLSTTCATACSVKTLTDLSGNGHDATQASNATRPTFVFSCQNAKPCMTMNGSQFLSIAALGNVSQPWTVIGVGQRTSGGFSNLFGDGSGTGYGILYN